MSEQNEDKKPWLTEELKVLLLKALSGPKTKVTFTKVDGTIREMQCTRKPETIAEAGWVQKEGTKPRKENPDVCAVFDLDKNEWRSFRFDSVTAFKVD